MNIQIVNVLTRVTSRQENFLLTWFPRFQHFSVTKEFMSQVYFLMEYKRLRDSLSIDVRILTIS